MNTDLKILSAFDALERKINALDNRFDGLSKQVGPKGDKGERGADGKAGRDGKDGKDGRAGKDGKNGKDGKDGVDGKNGVSVVDASIDLDNRLLLVLDDGTEIDAGAIELPETSTQVYSLGKGRDAGDTNVYIQDTQPAYAGKYLWVDTSGADITFWVEDGT